MRRHALNTLPDSVCFHLALLRCTVQADVGIGADFMQSTGGSYPFFAPEMCRAMRGAGYSGRAADMWAVGVSMFMWLYHRLPYEADSVVNLMERIANEEVDFPADGAHSAALLGLLRGLLERKPKMRMRIRDLRNDPWLTLSGKSPLPPAAVPPNAMAAPKSELANAVKRVQLIRRADDGMVPSAAPASVPTGAAPGAVDGPEDGSDAAAKAEAHALETQRIEIAREAAAEAAE